MLVAINILFYEKNSFYNDFQKKENKKLSNRNKTFIREIDTLQNDREIHKHINPFTMHL
jgi:cell division protein FtsB